MDRMILKVQCQTPQEEPAQHPILHICFVHSEIKVEDESTAPSPPPQTINAGLSSTETHSPLSTQTLRYTTSHSAGELPAACTGSTLSFMGSVFCKISAKTRLHLPLLRSPANSGL